MGASAVTGKFNNAVQAFLSHRIFGERGGGRAPSWAHCLPSLGTAWLAARRRALGYYDCQTLWLFRFTWRRMRSPHAMLAYVSFRRDLGFTLGDYWSKRLIGDFQKFCVRDRGVAAMLLREWEPEFRAVSMCEQLGSAVSEMIEKQEMWRAEFKKYVNESANKGVCVVGNSAGLIGAGLGEQINSKGVVLRFNRYRSAESADADIGNRLDVWVVAPGFDQPPPHGVKWIVVTGPDMRFRRKNWESLKPALHKGVRVLTVPLEVWRSLVRAFEAPPSAGVLALAWLREMLGTWEGVGAVGFGMRPTGEGAYHHVVTNQKAAIRHNWPAERRLLERWQSEGLALTWC